MALEIKTIPLLKNKIAIDFIKKAENSYKSKKNAIDFTKQIETMEKILAKSNVNLPT